MTEAANKPIRKKLFGDLWFEGENCVLYADSITHGVPIGELEKSKAAAPLIFLKVKEVSTSPL